MTFHPSWNLVDVFSVAQAGYLWHELEPPPNAYREITNPRPSHVAAIIQALQHSQQYEYNEKAGTLELVAKQLFADPFKTMRTREQLRQFAKSKRQYPRFLFDTLGPTNEDLAEQFIKSGPAPGPPAPADEPTAEKSNAGQPEGHDWDAATVGQNPAADETNTTTRTLRRGPEPGTIARYADDDRSLFAEIDRLMQEEKLSRHAATLRLAEEEKVAGTGTALSRAKRLAEAHKANETP